VVVLISATTFAVVSPVPARFLLRLLVNGVARVCEVEPRWLLSDVLRGELGLTGTHVGCEHGACGACTVLVNGEPVRSCLMFGVQAENAEITTVEGLSPGGDADLNPLQEAFRAEHGLQFGFCTPGILMAMTAFLRDQPNASEADIRAALSGHLCRCTGYTNIVRAVKAAHARLGR
jgi:carbon-monoxide dehydrogenase small subunit